MNRARHQRLERLFMLLADRAVFGLDREEEQDLAELAADFPCIDTDCLDWLAAALALANLESRLEPLPAHLRHLVRHRVCTLTAPKWPAQAPGP
ncbi:MAG: hypothetical protein KJZ87_21970 [Thermoguttaceae bacterium]|nr:hypothetical protein [Thermoguttaceae bacterium]